MEHRFIVIAIAVVAIAAIASIGLAYAFTAETTNSGNDFDGEPTTIRVLNMPGAQNNMGVHLQTININTDVTALSNGTWTVTDNLKNTTVTGYLDIKCPSTVNEDNPGKMRIWIEMEETESWTLIESIYFNIYMDGEDKSPTQYKLYGSDSELEEVASEPNRKDINIQTFTGSDARKFVIVMKLRDSFSVNPSRIDTNSDGIILKNTVYFMTGTNDPVVPLKIEYYVTDIETPAIVQSAYQGNVLEPPASPTGFRVNGWYTGYDTQNNQVTGRQWNFSEDHIDVENDGLTKINGFYTLKLYADYTLISYSIEYHYPEGSVISANPTHYDIETPTFTLNNPTLTGYTFTGWSGTDIVDGSGNPTKSTVVIILEGSSGNRLYTANWEYTITFDANNGTSDTTNQTVTKGVYTSLNKKPDSFTKGDLAFYGWGESPSGPVEYGDRDIVIDLGNKHLYAIWGNYLSITYASNVPADADYLPDPQTNLIPGTVKSVYGQGDLPTAGFIGWIDQSTGQFYAPNSNIEVGYSNITLYAVYTDNIVTFDRNGGSGSMSEQNVSSSVLLPLKANTFTRTGYAFYGWNTLATGEGTYYGNGDLVSPDSRLDLHAIWGHSVEYNSNGGSGTLPSTSVVKDNDPVVVRFAGLTKTGCTFKGWNSEPDGSGIDYAEGETIAHLTSNVMLYAVWECTVSFIATEVSYASSSKVLSGTTIQLPSGLEYGGHSLTAWSSGGSLYLPGKNIVVSGDMTFTAVWTDVVTITFEGGTGGTGTMPSQTVMKNVKTALNANTFGNSDGKAFYGWSGTENGDVIYQNCESVSLGSDTTLYAIWRNYVSFDMAGAPASIDAPGTVFINDDGTVDAPDLELDGYKVEWYKEAGLVNRFYFSDDANKTVYNASERNENHILYGKWLVNVYFICSGKTDKMDIFQYGVETQIPSEDTFAGCNYWNTRSDGSGTYLAKDAIITVTSPLGLYAMQSTDSIKFTINFKANNGSEVADVVQSNFETGSTALNSIASIGFTKTGYTFYEWNTAADGSGVWFGDGMRAMITKGMADADHKVDLYAIWNCKVTYDGNGSNGGTSVSAQFVYPNGTAVVSDCTFTKTNMAFYGWNTRSDGSGDYYQPGDNIIINRDTTLFAIWAYIITFYSNGGTGTQDSVICPPGGNVTLPSPTGMSRETYAFYEWNTANDGSGTYYSAGASHSFSGSTPLYAIWGHSVTFNAPDATSGDKVRTVVTLDSTIPFNSGGSPSRIGYTFSGWTDGINHYTSGTIPTTSNVTLNAEWSLHTYTISYTNASTYNGNPVTTPVSTPNSYNIASATITLGTPANSGYNFAGWSGSDLNGSYNSPVNIPTGSTGDKAYVAHWSKHVVTFDANGGYGVMPDQALITGTLDTCTFAKKGYTFDGWIDQDNTSYTNGQSITNLSKDLTLKAKWTLNS